jgi:hypothetical protein
MKFKKAEFESTWLQGAIDADYTDIKKVFGQPGKGDDYKVQAEWRVKFEDGTVATIYDYKQGKAYNGRHGIAKHIGGTTKEAVRLVVETLAEAGIKVEVS